MNDLFDSALTLQLITGNLGKAGGGVAFLAPKANTLGAWELGAVNPGIRRSLPFWKLGY